LQNFAGVNEISTWQDVSSLNPEDVMTRVYGTLKPYNPNLLGGYLAACVPCVFGMFAYCLMTQPNSVEKNQLSTINYQPSTLLWFITALLTSAALFATGCRGAYVAFMVMLVCMFFVSAKFLWQNYKKIWLSACGLAILLMSTAVLCVGSLRARVGSMFAMRQDSSNSFRFNVYQSSFEMFKDNWLLGIGVGNKNFREIYGLYMKTGFDALSAYNVFLEIAVESGIFALIAFLGFLVTLIRRAVLFIKNSSDIKTVIFVSSALTSILAVMAHGMVDTVFFRPQIQFIFWTMAATCTACRSD
jgi:putative inorganic carbon (HCO3(-)) transporter